MTVNKEEKTNETKKEEYIFVRRSLTIFPVRELQNKYSHFYFLTVALDWALISVVFMVVISIYFVLDFLQHYVLNQYWSVPQIIFFSKQVIQSLTSNNSLKNRPNSLPKGTLYINNVQRIIAYVLRIQLCTIILKWFYTPVNTGNSHKLRESHIDALINRLTQTMWSE